MNRRWAGIIITTFAIGLFFLFYNPTDPALSVSVSTDGRYVISGHASRKAHWSQPIGQIVLWDIEKKTKQIISTKANALSAMFIPDSHEFMWQDGNDIIYVQNVEGQQIKSFKHPFTIQNHRITADKAFYLSADANNHLYLGYGENIKTVYNDGASIGKPVDLSIVGNYFLAVTSPCASQDAPVAETNLTANPVNPSSSKKSSYDGVVLWDKTTLKPIAKLNGNCGATSGLISPDGKWVVASGENERDYMWEINNPNHRQRLARVGIGIYRENTDSYDKSQLLPIPDKFQSKQFGKNNTVSIAFLTEKDFILLGNSSEIKNYRKAEELARLFTVGDPWIKGYVEIGNHPRISTNYFQRNLSVSSSPTAHILVTGQATGGGINVYKYHPDKMELEKIWVAD